MSRNQATLSSMTIAFMTTIVVGIGIGLLIAPIFYTAF